MKRAVPIAVILVVAIGFCGLAFGATISPPSLRGIRIGDVESILRQNITRQPDDIANSGTFTMRRWDLDAGDSLTVTTQGGRVVFVELDWGRQADRENAGYDQMVFGSTTLREIREHFGSNGIAFDRRGPVAAMGADVVMLNAYEVCGVVAQFVTRIQVASTPSSPDQMADVARLDSVILAERAYAASQWGGVRPSPGYRPVQCG